MNHLLIDRLESLIEIDKQTQRTHLENEGFLLPDGNIGAIKINMISGVYVPPLIAKMSEADLDSQELFKYLKILFESEEYLSVFYFILLLYEALEIEPPSSFIFFVVDKNLLWCFVSEFLKDFESYITE